MAQVKVWHADLAVEQTEQPNYLAEVFHLLDAVVLLDTPVSVFQSSTCSVRWSSYQALSLLLHIALQLLAVPIRQVPLDGVRHVPMPASVKLAILISWCIVLRAGKPAPDRAGWKVL
eukprot:scaffold20044_cov22-Tisochrysis_lutea.AAC.1